MIRQTMSAWWPGAALATLLTAVAVPATAAPAGDPPAKAETSRAAQVAPLAGHYRFSGKASEVKALEEAIDAVVDDMNVVVRGVARRRLAKAADIPGELALSLRGEVLTVGTPEKAYSAPLDGKAVKVAGPSGDPLQLRHTVAGDAKLVQRFDGEDGTRINSCERVGKEGLRVRVTIHSEKLPRDLSYILTYVKKG